MGRRFINKKDPLYGFELKNAISSGSVNLLARATNASEKQIILLMAHLLKRERLYGLPDFDPITLGFIFPVFLITSKRSFMSGELR